MMTERTPRLLIVDDEIDLVNILEDSLRQQGYESMGFCKAEDALKAIASRGFDVALIDLVMPGMEGTAFLDKALRIDPHMVGVIMSGYGTIQNAVEAMRIGAYDYIVKPFQMQTLVSVIDRAVESRRLRMENEKLEKRQLLHQQRMHALGEMASGITHDFNNAIFPILGFADSMLDGPAKRIQNLEKVRKYFELIRISALDAMKVVERLQKFYTYDSKIDSEMYETIDLKKLLEEISLLTQPKWQDQAQASGKTISLSLHLQDVPEIYGNESELRVVFTNLIFNAADAICRKGEITVELYTRDRRVYVVIRDSGKGMPENVKNICFNPFFTTKKDYGAGLGLSITHEILQKHKATINVESTEGQGTVFTIGFVCNAKMAKGEKLQEISSTKKQLHILLVDDEWVNLEFLSEILVEEGHEVKMAQDGSTGWQEFCKDKFDIVITDLAMPNMNGYMLAAKIKEHSPTMPVIMMTGFGDLPEENQNNSRFIDIMIRKPLRIHTLRKAIRQVVKQEEPIL